MHQFGLSDSAINPPTDCPKVRFIREFNCKDGPVLAFVNQNNVYTHSGPGKEFIRVNAFNATDCISIEHTDTIEEIEGLGTYYWYQINDSEYIFGAFLEPVERMITE